MTDGRTPSDERAYATAVTRRAGKHEPDCKVYTAASCTCGLWARQDVGAENVTVGWSANGAGVDAELVKAIDDNRPCYACGARRLERHDPRCPTVNYGRGPGMDVMEETKAAQEGVILGEYLPADPVARKAIPIATGCIDYFPDAIAAVAALSYVGGQQHNPGVPLFWDRSKSGDEGDAMMRHFLQRGTIDSDGQRHSAKVAWRALALLQKELEAARCD